MTILDKIKAIESPYVSRWSDDAKWRAENREWLKKSTQIAIKILSALSSTGLTEEILAERIGITGKRMNKIIKGQENLDLKTISKLEKALQITLIEV